MSVHHLCIASGGDLVVLLPRSLALLLRELRRQRRDMLLSVETLLPSAFAGYLLRCRSTARPASTLCSFAVMRSCSAPAMLLQMLRAMRRRYLTMLPPTAAVCVWR